MSVMIHLFYYIIYLHHLLHHLFTSFYGLSAVNNAGQTLLASSQYLLCYVMLRMCIHSNNILSMYF